MARKTMVFFILAGLISLASAAATAQEVVHALTGTVNHVNAAAKTITVITDDGSDGTFQEMGSSHASIAFDKSVRNQAIPAGQFKESGAHVIVFYYGEGDMRTVVALRNLGPGPLTRSTGTVVRFDKGSHSLTIKEQSGAVDSFKITRETVADTDGGAAEGLKFEPRQGDLVNITAAQPSGSKDYEALFVSGA